MVAKGGRRLEDVSGVATHSIRGPFICLFFLEMDAWIARPELKKIQERLAAVER